MKAELERLLAKLDKGISSTIEVPAGEVFADVHAGLERILTRSDWIPVSERLPDAITRVWATWARADGRGNFVGMAYVNEDGSWFCWDTGDVMDTPLAWQPIEEPAPYRAEGVDQ